MTILKYTIQRNLVHWQCNGNVTYIELQNIFVIAKQISYKLVTPYP